MKYILLCIIITSLLLNLTTCDDVLQFSLQNSLVSTQSTYTILFSTDHDITPIMGSTITIAFPNDYQGRLNSALCSINVILWSSGSSPSPTCSFSGLLLTIIDAFTTGQTYMAGNPFIFELVGVTNPFSTQATGLATLTMTLNSGTYTITAQNGVTCTIGSMSCTVATIPTKVNQNGQLIVTFTAPEFPIGSTLRIQSPSYWQQAQPPQQSGSEIIQSSNLTCQPVLNSIAGISCSYYQSSGNYIIYVSNIASTSFNSSSISLGISTVLSPPTTKPQGSFKITSSFNNSATMTQCTGVQITSATAGSITVGSFSTNLMTVNAAGVATLNFVINSNLISTDTFVITFPSTFSLASLTSVYINNGGVTVSSPTISGQSVTLTGAIAYIGDTISVQFTKIINPPSQLTTSAIQITTKRSGYSIETSTGTITFSAYRSTINNVSLSSTSLQIGVTCNYIISFTLGQPLISSSAIVVSLPTALQGKVGGCSPTPCTVTSSLITFTSPSTTVNSSITLTLTNVVNPYNLGVTTSLTLYTLYYSNQSSSIVEFVNTGLTLTLIARASTNANVVISPSSYVVSKYPVTYTITITNLNPFFAYTYLSLYIPPEITSGGSVICQSGQSVQSCSFNSSTNFLTFSAFSTAITAGQLSSSPFSVQNLINPSTTLPTSSFQVYFYNSNNQLVEYVTSGLSVQMTTAANFSALSLIPNNTINSALTSLSVVFNVPSTSYQNNSLLVLTFPSVVSLSNVDCGIVSSNILAINQCSVLSNTVKIYLSYSSLSTFTSTKLTIGPYNNYPSLQSYSIQADLYGDIFEQSKLCSNAGLPIILTNTQTGAIGISTFSFSNAVLLSTSNLMIRVANVSGTSFTSMTIKFPPDFVISSSGCSVPSQTSCSLSSSDTFNLTTSSSFSLPLTVTVTSLITTPYTPSSYIYIQTFSSSGYQMDSNEQVYFSTTCTLPCKTCQSASQPSVCTSCYTNTSLNQISGAINLNGTMCSSQCGSGYYVDSNNICQLCSTSCLTCSAFSACLTCNGSYLYNSSCLTNCPFTFYGSNFQCFACPTSIFCLSCTDNYHCSSCINGYYYYNQQCLLTCPSLITYPNSVNNTCSSCPQNCTNCQGNSTLVTCTVCDNGYVLDGTGCYLNCVTAGTYAVSGICQGCSSLCLTCSVTYTNCTSCYSNSSNPYLYNNNCISVCPNGFYADNSSFSCSKCVSPCQYCNTSSIHSCLTCTAGYYLFGSDCLSNCPTYYYNSSGSCLLCVSPCLTCTTELSCLSCTNNTYLYQNQCLNQCPANMAVVNGNECLVCPTNCKVCSTATTCTTCYNGSYLYNGTCLNICPTTTFANTTSGVCDPCVSPCLACTSLTVCTSCADTTKFLVNNTCIACDSPCLTCSLSISNCTSCISSSSTPYYLNFNCLSICPSNYYSDNSTFQCTPCASPCASCYGPTNVSCGSCAMSYYLLLGICYTVCPSTYFNNVTQCSPCQSPCLTCSNAKDVCLSCINTYYLLGSSCVLNCGTGMSVINNSICDFCSSNCQTCLSSNSSTCTSCYATYFLQNSVCGTSCQNYYYADNNSSQCLSCISPCSTCQTASICLSCLDSSLFLVNGTCLSCAEPCLTCSGLRTNCTSCNATSLYPYLSGGTCVSNCPATYYPSIYFACVKCNSPCNSCQNDSSSYCLSCLSNYYLLSSTCYANCPTGYFNNITICSVCVSPCFTCSDANTCLSCVANYYLFGSNCVSNCSGMAIINGTTCQYCSPSCQTCSSLNSSSCTSCYNSTYLLGVSCVTNCTSTYYGDSSVNKCMNCAGSCYTCLSLNYCLSCLDPTLYVVNGSCVGCSSPCITCTGTVSNCTSCAVSTGFPYLLNNSCLATCPSTYYNDGTLNTCVKCISPCQTCTSASVCQTCITGYLFLTGYCLPACPNGYYSNGTACLGCLSPCKNCFDDLNCISCASGFYLMGSQCVSNCTTGMILVNNTYCQYCNGSCVTCLTANSSYCTSCATTQFVQWGNCVNICSNGYYGNTTTGSCLVCIAPCGNCTSETSCLSCLDSSLILLNNSCVSCSSPCMTCSITRSNCTSCDPNSSNPLLFNNLCLSNCLSGYYSTLTTCLRCNSPCDTCQSVSNSTCLTCLSGYVMLNSTGACLLNCPNGYYSNTVYCVLCTNNCSTCSSDSICLSCPNGLYLMGASCVSSCPNGTITTSNSSTGGICAYCISSCFSCQTSNTSYCTSCPSNSYLLNGQCLSTCSFGFYGDTTLWVCSPCVSPCSSCVGSSTQCLSCIDSSKVVTNLTCMECVSPCLTCSSTIYNCTSCNTSGTYPYYYSNTCLTGCPSTYYNDSSFLCKPCVSPCYTCTGSGNQSCLTCVMGYYQLGSICYTNCPSGYFNNGTQCSLCVSPCFSCTGSSNITCTSCQGGLYLLGSTCVNNCSGYATNGSTCVYCSATCLTCYTNNNTFCTSCSNGLFLFNGACVTNCSSGFYADSASFVCMACINNCSTCTSATSCITCSDPNLFVVNSQCVSCSSPCLTCSGIVTNCTSCNVSSSYPILFGSSCLSACPNSYYNSTPTTCTKCSVPCDYCSSSGTNACLTCLSGYYFLANVCYSTCPTTYFQNVTICSPCDSSCQACQSSAFTCVSCKSGLYLRGSLCVNNCSSGQVLVNNTYCSVCLGNCFTCLSSNFSYCTSCSNSLYLFNGVCYSTCPSQTYGNSSTSSCISCKSPCLTCSSDTICLTCNPSTPYLVNNTCVSCSSPCLTCQNVQTNCTSCDTSSSKPYLFNFNCLASCPSTYYNDGAYNCVRCSSPCDTCTSSSNRSCLTCLTGYSQLGTDCYLNCPSTYYSNGTHCVSCDLSVCKTCEITSTTCLSCNSGLYLYGSLCNSSCPSGMIIYNGSVCASCLNSCYTCLSSNDSYCTSCFSDNYLYSGTCSSTCISKFYADSSSGKCKSCQSPCLTCLSVSSCLSCLSSQDYLQNFTCVSSCTYPLIGINNVCYQCASQCLSCVQNITMCLLCSNGYYYFSSSLSCSLTCNYFILRANQSTSGNNECTQTCPSGTFTDSSSQYCQACPSACKVCVSSTNCSQCNTGYSYYSQFCYSSCPVNAPYSINSICLVCNIANCQTCLSTTYCSACTSPYLLINQGSSSSCISACPTGYTYNLATTSCISNSGNSSGGVTNVVSSSLPPYTFLITTAVLVFGCFIIKFKYAETSLSLVLFVSVIFTSSFCLINILYIEIVNLGISKGNANQASFSTYLILSNSALQVISSIASFIAVLKIKDSSLVKMFKKYPVTIAAILILSTMDSNVLFLTLSNFMNLGCFKIKYASQMMDKLLKVSLSISIVTKCLNIVYSGIQLNYYSSNAYRLLSETANFPINNAYTIELIVISCFAILIIIYLLYHMNLSDKIQNAKNDSNQSLIDDGKVFDQRNSSNSQLIFEAQSNDMIVDINNLNDENDVPSETKRYKKLTKVTPDQMLEKMNNGIEEEAAEKQETQGDNLNKNTREENQARQEDQMEQVDINNVFYLEEENQQIDENKENNEKKPNHPQENEFNNSPDISDIVYNDQEPALNEPSKFLQNEINAIQQAINERTKTQIINVFSIENNEIKQENQQKYSPSQLSKYQPNQKIEQQFANSYLDDANKFNQHNEVLKKSGRFINFEVENRDFNEQGSDEREFDKRQNYATIGEPQRFKARQMETKPRQTFGQTEWFEQFQQGSDHQFKKTEWQRKNQKEQKQEFKKTQWDDIIDVPFDQQPIIRIEEEEQFNENTTQEKVTPMKNSFFEMEENYEDIKPSEGLKKAARRNRNKPDIPLPKNEIQKQIMNIYQKKDKKELPPRKKRYPPEGPTHKKNSKNVQHSAEEPELTEEKTHFNPLFSSELKRQMPNRYNQSIGSNQKLYDDDDQLPEKPSIRLRKSSFKKIGEMVLDQSQNSGRK